MKGRAHVLLGVGSGKIWTCSCWENRNCIMINEFKLVKPENFGHLHSVYHFTVPLRIHWRLSTILKRSSKSVWSNVFWLVKVYIFWNFIQYTIHWDKTQMLKTISFGQNKRYKNTLFFFLSKAPTYHSFTFDLQFLYELKHMVLSQKTVSWIFHFRFCLVFIKLYMFVQQKAWAP